MLAGKPHLVFRLRRGGAHPRHLVGRDGHPDAGRADQDTAIGAAFGHLPGYRLREIRVIAGIGRVRPEIDQFVAFLREPLPQLLFESKPGMIRGNRNFHKRGES